MGSEEKSRGSAPATGPAPAAPPKAEASRRLAAVLIALIVIVALIAGAAYVLTVGNQQEEQPRAKHATASLSGTNLSAWSGFASREWAGGTYTLNVTLNQTASLDGTGTTLQVWLGPARFGIFVPLGEAVQATNGTWSFNFTGAAGYKNLGQLQLTLEASPVDDTKGVVVAEGIFGLGVGDPDYALIAAAGGGGPFVDIAGSAHATVNETNASLELVVTNLTVYANLSYVAWLLNGTNAILAGTLAVNETTGNATLLWTNTYASAVAVPTFTGVAITVQNAEDATPAAAGLQAASAAFTNWTTA